MSSTARCHVLSRACSQTPGGADGLPGTAADPCCALLPAAGTQAAAWAAGGGPSPSELRMMGANSSVSFKKSTLKQGVLRPLANLPPFVPRLFIEDITLNHEKFSGFDAAGRDLTAASKTIEPSIIELQVWGLMWGPAGQRGRRQRRSGPGAAGSGHVCPGGCCDSKSLAAVPLPDGAAMAHSSSGSAPCHRLP